MKLKVVWRYLWDDTELDEDYYNIDVYHEDKLIVQFGDYYHDKGQEKLKGFIKGVEWATGKNVEVETVEVKDHS